MEPILKSEIFFFISSISLVIVTIIILVIGIYLIKIMRNFSQISSRLKKMVYDTSSSLEEVGEHIKESPLFTFIFGKKRKKEKKD